jgi:hypothetical protein
MRREGRTIHPFSPPKRKGISTKERGSFSLYREVELNIIENKY